MPAFPSSTTVLDSILFRDAFGTPAMREVFSDISLISRYAAVEIALAKAEAGCGVIAEKIQIPGVAAHHGGALVAGLIHDRAFRCAVDGRLRHKSRAQRVGAELGRSQAGLLAILLHHAPHGLVGQRGSGDAAVTADVAE